MRGAHLWCGLLDHIAREDPPSLTPEQAVPILEDLTRQGERHIASIVSVKMKGMIVFRTEEWRKISADISPLLEALDPDAQPVALEVCNRYCLGQWLKDRKEVRRGIKNSRKETAKSLKRFNRKLNELRKEIKTLCDLIRLAHIPPEAPAELLPSKGPIRYYQRQSKRDPAAYLLVEWDKFWASVEPFLKEECRHIEKGKNEVTTWRRSLNTKAINKEGSPRFPNRKSQFSPMW